MSIYLKAKEAVGFLKTKLEEEGFYASIDTKAVGGSMLNVVTVGRFTDKSETTSLLEHLSRNYKINGRVISINKK